MNKIKQNFNLFYLCSPYKNNFDKWLLLMIIIILIKQNQLTNFFVFPDKEKKHQIHLVLPIKDVSTTKLFQEM